VKFYEKLTRVSGVLASYLMQVLHAVPVQETFTQM